ncbi:MAG: hypothetical protein ACR2PB_02480 [Desulfocapsaceae bacterium]
MKSWLIHIIKYLIIAEIIYLLLINVALNLPLTQTIVNNIKPEKYRVTWSRAWSFYPFRVHARTIFANGQSSSQQWQAEAPAASASISLLSLFWHTVKLDNVEARNVIYKQRPRPKTGKDYSEIRPYFPPIDNRQLETEVAAPPPLKKENKPWKIIIGDIFAHGSHEIWLFQVQGKIAGELRTDLSIQTRGGPFSLSNGEVDVELDSLVINGDDEVLREGHIAGSVEFLPFVPKENKGVKIFDFLNLDVEIQTETESLAFLNVYLTNFQGLKVDGTGLVQGRVHMRQGSLEDGSDLEVAARKLSMDLLDYRLEGEGKVGIKTSETSEDTDVLISFSSLKAFDTIRDVLLFSGDGVAVEARGNRSVVPSDEKPFIAKRLAVSIPAVDVPDLAAYQAYLPDKWLFKLHGGMGRLQGFTELTQTGFNTDLQLISEAADVGLKDYRFTSNLDMALKADSPAIGEGIDVSGSYVHLEGATLSHNEQQSSKPWYAGVDIEQGKIKLLLPEDISSDAGFIELYESIKDTDIAALLDSGEENIIITGSISDLSWLSVLFENRFGLTITGSGDVTAAVVLSQGWLGTGSKLEILPQTLGVDFLDYSAEGDGKASLLVEKGGEHPDVNLIVELEQGVMQRRDETQAFIENVRMILQALVKNIAIGEKEMDIDLHLQIPKADIKDMSAYNQYLPPNSPMEFTGGTANLSADIKMAPETADGYVRLKATDMSARIDQQAIEGELQADITLIDGVPENMEFDISGSSVTLDNVKVVGAETSHDDENWAARFRLKKAHAVWKRPISILIEADLEMTDSKPIVAVIANQRGRHGWLGRALTTDDVTGEANIDMAQDRIVIPYAFATSDRIDVGAKGVITAEKRNGVLYVRFRRLHGILKINDGKRNLDILGAREKFDQFDSEAVLRQMSSNTISNGDSKEAGN